MNSMLERHEELENRFESLGQSFSKDLNLKLERIEYLLQQAGNPHKSFRCIHVGGTSGKGTVSNLISNILRENNIKVGMFTSPYLQVINESCLINGRMIDVAQMSDLLDLLWPNIEHMRESFEFGAPSYFETLFAVSMLAFRQAGVDAAVIEVGLGGKLDATNVIDADISVLVSVGLDHIEVLGPTVEDIARDKVQIIKPGQRVICGFLQPETRQIAKKQSDLMQADLKLINADFSYSLGQEKLTIRSPHSIYDFSLMSSPGFIGHNSACAVLACEAYFDTVQTAGIVEILENSLQNTQLPGRGEVIDTRPLTILDGAHNPDKIRTAVDTLRSYEYKKLVVLYASKEVKSSNSTVEAMLLGRQKEIFTTLCHSNPEAILFTEFHSKGIWHSSHAGELAECFKKHTNIPCEVVTCPIEGFRRAKYIAGEDGVVLVTGSFHLVGEIRNLYVSKKSFAGPKR